MPVSKSFNPPQVGDRTIEDFNIDFLEGRCTPQFV